MKVSPDRLDLYGRRTVFEAKPDVKHEHRYLVWYGGESSKKGWPVTYRTLWFALRRAEKLRRSGYHVRVSDRLIQEGDSRALPVTESTVYKS